MKTEAPDNAFRFEDEPRSGRLGFLEILKIAWRSIRANMLRSILTALGVIIGVAAVVALVSVGNGVRQNVTNRFSSFGTNLLTIQSGQSGFGGPPGLVRGGATQTLTLADAEALRDLKDTRIEGIAPASQSNGQQVKAGSNNTTATVIGSWPDYEVVQNAEVQAGTYFTTDDVDKRRRVAVIGNDIVTELFPEAEASSVLGQSVKISNVSYDIVGVLKEQATAGFNDPNTNIIIPISTFSQRLERSEYKGEPTVRTITVKVADARDVSAVEADLTTLMANLHEKTSSDDYDFNIRNQASQLESVTAVFSTLTLFLGAIAGISLLVGGIGIMNIMLVSVTERTREIGVRKALGAKPRDILSQFLLEAIVLSCAGGLIGIGIGMVIAYFSTSALSVPFVVSIPSMVLAFAFSAAVGIFFGFYPARRAAKLDPVDSLRYE
ncbi:MAG: ABC transporter permease [Trueperaceae bacterium]|nr:ABC transporter permease [Trueperaceae bacterium]